MLAYTSSGRLWIGTLNGGLNLYVEADESFTHLRHDENDPLSLSSNDVQDILWDEQGRLWVATTGGIDLVQGQKVTRHLLRQTGVSHSDDVAFITSVWADRHERIWFGTLGAGIYIQDPNLNGLKIIFTGMMAMVFQPGIFVAWRKTPGEISGLVPTQTGYFSLIRWQKR